MPKKKPPLGVMPEAIWHEHFPDPTYQDWIDRAGDLEDAFRRYIEAGVVPPLAWVTQLALANFIAGELSADTPVCPEPSLN